MKYNVKEYGTGGKRLGQVEAESVNEATVKGAAKYGLAEEDVTVDRVEPRVDAECQYCGESFKMSESGVKGGYRKVCTLCRKDEDMQHKARIFLKAQEEFEALKKKRALKAGMTVGEYGFIWARERKKRGIKS